MGTNDHRFGRVPVAGLLLVLVAVGGCISGGPSDIASNDDGPRELPDDPYLDVEPTGNVEEIDLWVDEQAVMEPYGDQTIGAFAFAEGPDQQGTVPGPEIRVTQGDTVRVTLHDPENVLQLPGHTMHWHGYDVPWRMDGVPFLTQDLTPAGEEGTYTYEFVAKQPGTYWYHCVVEFPAHVDFGMLGAFIVEPRDGYEYVTDREETLIFHETDSQMFSTWFDWPLNPNSDPDPDRLSSNPFDTAESLEGQARMASDVGSKILGDTTGYYAHGEGPRDYYPIWSPRYRPSYDTFMINGRSYPDTEPVTIREGENLRLRLINAGPNPKSLHLHGHKMLVTHNDGYPLPDPHWEDTIGLASGERVDVYVQGTNPGIWNLHDHSGAAGMGTTVANDYAFPGGMKTVLVYEGFEPPVSLPAVDGNASAGDYAVFAHGGVR